MRQQVTNNQQAMQQALRLARIASRRGEVPVGAIILDPEYRRIAVAHNQIEARQDATAHAEMLVLARAMSRLDCKFLIDCTIIVTLEPCPMCAAAIREARIATLVYGADDPKGGAVANNIRLYQFPSIRPPPKVIAGIYAEQSVDLLRGFFRSLRAN